MVFYFHQFFLNAAYSGLFRHALKLAFYAASAGCVAQPTFHVARQLLWVPQHEAKLFRPFGIFIAAKSHRPDILPPDAGFLQAKFHRLRGKTRPVLDAPHPFFFNCRHQNAISEQGSRGICMMGIDAQHIVIAGGHMGNQILLTRLAGIQYLPVHVLVFADDAFISKLHAHQANGRVSHLGPQGFFLFGTFYMLHYAVHLGLAHPANIMSFHLFTQSHFVADNDRLAGAPGFGHHVGKVFIVGGKNKNLESPEKFRFLLIGHPPGKFYAVGNIEGINQVFQVLLIGRLTSSPNHQFFYIG